MRPVGFVFGQSSTHDDGKTVEEMVQRDAAIIV
jgi:hypothetical protein